MDKKRISVPQQDKKPLDYYLEKQYAVTLTPDSSGRYVAEIKDLPGCIIQGNGQQDALKKIDIARQLWIETAYEDGKDIPTPLHELTCNGKVLVRMSPALHRRLLEESRDESVSLNNYIVTNLAQVSRVAHLNSLNEAKIQELGRQMDNLKNEIKEAVDNLKGIVLQRLRQTNKSVSQQSRMRAAQFRRPPK